MLRRRSPLARLASLHGIALVLALGAGPVRAELLAELSAEQLLNLRIEARAYEHGEGVPRDPDRAIRTYCEAARYGDVEAQFSLGWLYANGRGVARDDALAAFYFGLAAKQGHQQARNMLRFVGAATAPTPECMRPPVAEDSPPVEADFVATSADQERVAELVYRLAPEYGVHPRLALAVIRAESNFDFSARSARNAQGLMQLIPETSARFNVRKPFDPAQNIRGGLAYLRWLLAYFKGDVALVAAAYNAGEGTVNRYRDIPPYPETRAYVKRILDLFRQERHPYDARVTDPSPELPRIRTIKATKSS